MGVLAAERITTSDMTEACTSPLSVQEKEEAGKINFASQQNVNVAEDNYRRSCQAHHACVLATSFLIGYIP